MSAHQNNTTVKVRLFLVSFLILFLEMALIRWLPTKVRAISYFSNLVLLSSFLGLGIGCLTQRIRKDLLPYFPILLSFLTYFAFYFSFFMINDHSGGTSEHLWLLYADLSKSAPTFSLDMAIILFFVTTTFVFVPLGQSLGQCIREFSPLIGYSIDIVGSLCGILLFALCSYFQLPPTVWFAVTIIIFLVLIYENKNTLIISTLLSALILYGVYQDEQHDAWSPYYAISVKQYNELEVDFVYPSAHMLPSDPRLGFVVCVNGSMHQGAVNFSKRNQQRYSSVKKLFDSYSFPYHAFKTPPKKALIVGAGTGNDVAIALANGVEHIDAVEIDPVIYQIGKQSHPNQPYSSPKVKIHITDARSFLQNTNEKYDIIVFGTLDSQTLLSGLSTMRLDNYIYTYDCMRQARSLLQKDGALALYYWVGRPWIFTRHFRMVTRAFDNQYPYVYSNKKLFNKIFMAGPGLKNWPQGMEAIPSSLKKMLIRDTSRIPDDNWPFLYSKNAQISPFYLKIALFIILFACISIFCVSPYTLKRFSPPFFLLGAGFLLLETRGITQATLFFGSTWWVNAFVFFCVLSVILIANLLIIKFPSLPISFIIGGIITSLSMAYFLPNNWVLSFHFGGRIFIAAIFLILPILFASLLFSRLFAQTTDIEVALGSNLLGTVFGGLLEFSCVVFGMSALYILAALIYLGAVTTRK